MKHTVRIREETVARQDTEIEVEAPPGASDEDISYLAVDRLTYLEQGLVDVGWDNDEIIDGSGYIVEAIDGRDLESGKASYFERDSVMLGKIGAAMNALNRSPMTDADTKAAIVKIQQILDGNA